jgi:hypothetical protein
MTMIAVAVGAVVVVIGLLVFIRGLGTVPRNKHPPGRSDGM